MENAPQDETKKSTKKATATGRRVGAVAVQPETRRLAKPEASREPETSKDIPPQKLETDPETPPEKLTADEKAFIERELIRAADNEEVAPLDTLDEDDPETKVRKFRHRVLEGESSDEVADEIIRELEVPSDTPDEPARSQEAEPHTDTHESDREVDSDSTGQGSNNGTPPPLPTPPLAGGAGGTGNGGNRPRPSFNAAPLPAPANPNVVPPTAQAPAEYYDYGNPAAAALLGGIVGYLIGRRRGRIKTEKKLVPIQKKLQKEVVNLNWQLQFKEHQIRTAARERARLKTNQQDLETRLAKKPEPLAGKIPTPERLNVQEKNTASESPVRERLGKVIFTAEAKPEKPSTESEPEKQPREKTEHPETKLTEKDYAMLTRPELLKLSEKIIVDGTSLRQIYENRLVGERGLRRLVTEHLRGGDVKRQLRREIVEREIDFERDPVMRDHASPTSSKPLSTAGAAALQALVQEAATKLPASSDDAYLKALDDQEADEKHRRQTQQHILDAGMVLVIVALLSLILFLFFTRH